MSEQPKRGKGDDFLRTVGAIALLFGGVWLLSQCGGDDSYGGGCHIDNFTGVETGDC